MSTGSKENHRFALKILENLKIINYNLLDPSFCGRRAFMSSLHFNILVAK